MLGIGARDSFTQLGFDGDVGLRHVAPIGLLLDLEVAAKVVHRDPVGGIGELQTKGEKRLELAQARILSPFGSKRGSLATVAGTQRPKTWTSTCAPGVHSEGRYA